jgi:serine protease AprX
MLTRALPATLSLALLWPAAALATPPNADLDHDKVTDSLESHIAGLPDDSRLRLIVSLDEAATSGRVKALERAVGDMSVRERFRVVDAVALTATKEQVRELADQGVVDRVEQDLPVRAADTPTHARNDSAQASFGVTEARLDAPNLDGDVDGDPSTYSSADLVAAVIDSGIDSAHLDLDGGKVLAFKDFVNDPDPTDANDPAPYDDDGHGTHVAATIAGSGEADPRYRGVAPGAALVGVKVLDSQGDGFTSDVVAGIQWVVAHKDDYGIEAINLSLGTEGCGDGFGADSQAVNEAHAAGLVVAVAAGNDGPATCTIGSPGDAKDALTVGAMADLGANGFKQADFSGRGPTADGRIKPDISAPGVGITSAAAGTAGGYVSMNGTSMATPFVTGVALLMLDANPALLNDDLKEDIRSTAIDWGRGGNSAASGTSGPDVDLSLYTSPSPRDRG